MNAVARPLLAGEPARVLARPRVRGKFLFVGDEKFYVRGVTYGTFRPRDGGEEFPTPATVARDFARMAASGINTVRTYTVPPGWLLDCAYAFGLRVMVGLPLERYVGFLADKSTGRNAEPLLRGWVRSCRGHPALLCYAIGNEIPAAAVRWHGRRRIERYVERAYSVAKSEDPAGVVTYVNYPSTEYLQLPFIDVVCFNTYLESEETLAAYLARLQIIAADRPLIMSELGIDSHRHGEEMQARVLDWQIRTAFASGCAGAFVYAWTDEWYRGGADVDDWEFGLTRRDRRSKPALGAVTKAFAGVPFPSDGCWPRVSVVICSHNGAQTIGDCFAALRRLDYPHFDVIVVDDGSTDATAAIANTYPCRLIRTPNRGLSSARNTGLQAARGEIVAYLDDDAYPDPHWLSYLVSTLVSSDHAGVGGPNIGPPDDGPIADCVSNAPGNPTHVLLSDRVAEHIPGCNMAFRKDRLEAIGGFDPQFRAAGDDVDVCWRLQEAGWTLGFSPAAVAWHHRRNSVRAFWKQQVGYGKAEALLERKWPEKYNGAGHPSWSGRVYGRGIASLIVRPGRIYYGVWGSAPFQSMSVRPARLLSLPAMPEWYLVIGALGVLGALGSLWKWMLLALPLFIVALGLSLFQAARAAKRASFSCDAADGRVRITALRCLTGFLHLLQPLARLRGRLAHGLSPWRRRHERRVFPRRRHLKVWTERWRAPQDRLQTIEAGLRATRSVVRRGGDFDRWDLEVPGGLLGGARVLMLVEEHGQGQQLVRVRAWPRCSATGVMLALLLGGLSVISAVAAPWHVAAIFCVLATVAGFGIIRECGSGLAVILDVLEKRESERV